MSSIVVVSNWQFLGIFLPVFLIIYYITPVKWRNAVLFGGSILFYAAGSPVMVLLLLGLTVLNYYCGNGIFILEREERNRAYRESRTYTADSRLRRRLAVIIGTDAGVLIDYSVAAEPPVLLK